MTTAALYYESHITIEPVFNSELLLAKKLAGIYRFKVADLLMKKRESDTEERSKNDTFMTGHGTDLDDIKRRTNDLVKTFLAAGIKVFRYKIEDTVLDSRHEDVFGLLATAALSAAA